MHICIFDEVKTGFRSGPGGYQEIAGVTPHLSIFGKAVANGYPLGVIGGQREIMLLFDSPDPLKRVLISGTSCKCFRCDSDIEYVEESGHISLYRFVSDRLYTGIEKLFDEKGIPSARKKRFRILCLFHGANAGRPA